MLITLFVHVGRFLVPKMAIVLVFLVVLEDANAFKPTDNDGTLA